MLSSTLLLVRHRESAWNAARRWSGCADVELTDVGRAQSAAMAPAIARFNPDRIVASDLRRAAQTATIVATALGLAPPQLDARLREHDTPLWTGLTRDEIDQRFPGALDGWRSGVCLDLPGAERWAELEARVIAGLHAAAESAGGGNVFVVAHAGVLRAVMTAVGGGDIKVGRSKGVLLRNDERGLRVIGITRVMPSEASDAAPPQRGERTAAGVQESSRIGSVPSQPIEAALTKS